METIDQEVLAHIRLDMEQVYTQHRAAETMIHNMLRLSLAILSLPILAFGAYITAAKSVTIAPGQVAATNSTSNLTQGAVGATTPSSTPEVTPPNILINLPDMLAWIAVFTGILNFIPVICIFENHKSEILCKHAINSFRALYVSLQTECSSTVIKDWKTTLSIDNTHPKPMRWSSSAVVMASGLILFNCVYLAAGWTSLTAHTWTIFITFAIVGPPVLIALAGQLFKNSLNK